MIHHLEQLGIRAVFYSDAHLFIADDVIRAIGYRQTSSCSEFIKAQKNADICILVPIEALDSEINHGHTESHVWTVTLLGLVYFATSRRLMDTYEILHAVVFRKPGEVVFRDCSAQSIKTIDESIGRVVGFNCAVYTRERDSKNQAFWSYIRTRGRLPSPHELKNLEVSAQDHAYKAARILIDQWLDR